jgi:hypothetical protein
VEPLFTHRDVTTIMAFLGDINANIKRIRELLEEDDDGEEEVPEADT